jgi:hypothetical protein
VTEPGINSPEEFLFLYLSVGILAFIAWAFWDSTEEFEEDRDLDDAVRARQRRRCRVIAILGIVNMGFALAALDRAIQHARLRPGPDAESDVRWARVWLVAGIAIFAGVTLPHLAQLADLVADPGPGRPFAT